MATRTSLGIDLGTSELKAVILDEQGRVLEQAGERLAISRPQAGWSEQDPEDWWRAALSVLDRLRQAAPQAYAHVAAIGLSGQMHGAVLLGTDDRPLRPAILWDDARAVREAARLVEQFPAFARITGSLAMAGLTAPKLLWLQTHEPALFARIACVLAPKDYLRLKLCGERVTDVSDAAGALWIAVERRDWFEPMLRASGLAPAQLPALVESHQPTGRLGTRGAALGLAADVVVAAGGGDNPVQAVGIGAIEAGDAFVQLGTSAAFVAVTDHAVVNPEAAVHGWCHAWPGRWYAMGAMLSGASCLRWLTTLLGLPSEAMLLQRIEAALPRGRAPLLHEPLFLPYLAGERTPHNDPRVRGGFMNLGHDSTPELLGRAVLEGVAFGLRDAMQAVQAAGATATRCTLVGGGAKSAYWAQLLADVLELPIVTRSGSALGGCIGAARLGFIAAGGDPAQARAGLPVDQVFEPDAALGAALQARHARFRGLFPAAQALGRNG